MAFILSLCVANIIHAQRYISGYNENIINPDLLEKSWAARWISYPGASNNDYGIYHFRKSFNLEEIPSSMIIHVSADNRYKLFVNGNLASLGPARGDVYNWNFETVDISKFLRKGKNVLAAVVWNYGDKKPVAQMSLNKTGFILQGNSERDTIINTDNRWLCLENKAYAPWTDWQVLGYGKGCSRTRRCYKRSQRLSGTIAGSKSYSSDGNENRKIPECKEIRRY